MNARDYNVGNYLWYLSETHGEPQEKMLCKIDAEDLLTLHNSKKYNDLHEPIPLTEKILKTTGFKTSGIEHIYNSICLIKAKQGYDFYYCDRVDKNITYMVKIQFVHELQNLYYTLERKEIEIIFRHE